MPKNGNNKLKHEVRARMAETGENYTTALRRVQEERQATCTVTVQGRVISETLLVEAVRRSVGGGTDGA